MARADANLPDQMPCGVAEPPRDAGALVGAEPYQRMMIRVGVGVGVLSLGGLPRRTVGVGVGAGVWVGGAEIRCGVAVGVLVGGAEIRCGVAVGVGVTRASPAPGT